MKIESPSYTDPVSLFLHKTIGQEAFCKELIRNPTIREHVLKAQKEEIDSFDPQQTELLIQTMLTNLTNQNVWNVNQRDTALLLMRLIDFKKVDQGKLVRDYLTAINNLPQHADVFGGEIDALLEAGTIIAPYMPNTKLKVNVAWNTIASRFANDVDALDHINSTKNKISELIPYGNSDFHSDVKTLYDEGLKKQEIADQLDVSEERVMRAISRLIKRNQVIPHKKGRPKGSPDNIH